MYIRTSAGLVQGPRQYGLGAWAAATLPTGMKGKLYQFNSKHGGSTTAVYVPDAALATDPVWLLVWIHGDLICCDEGKDAVSLVKSIQFPLTQQIADSKLPIVLIAPSMKWRAGQHSHTLGSPRAMNAFIEEVRSGLTQAGWKGVPEFGRLILAGHSRAYAVLNGLATSVSDAQSSLGALGTLTDVWLLDTTYGKANKAVHCKNWLTWAKAKRGVNLRIFYIKGSDTAAVAECIRDEAAKAGLSNVTVQDFHRCFLSHCGMPRHHSPALLAASARSVRAPAQRRP